jgi:hypothetical protein
MINNRPKHLLDQPDDKQLRSIDPFACTVTEVEHDASSILIFLSAQQKDDADADVDHLL